jgi:hypothetical protein
MKKGNNKTLKKEHEKIKANEALKTNNDNLITEYELLKEIMRG